MFAASAGAGTDVGMESKGVVSSPNDLHDVLDPVELGKGTCWEATEEAPQFNAEQASEQSARTLQEPRPAINPWSLVGWESAKTILTTDFMVRAKEGLFLLVHHRREMFCKAKKAR